MHILLKIRLSYVGTILRRIFVRFADQWRPQSLIYFIPLGFHKFNFWINSLTGNYTEALNDAKIANFLQPSYLRAIFRGKIWLKDYLETGKSIGYKESLYAG